jgi:hypothetical protein
MVPGSGEQFFGHVAVKNDQIDLIRLQLRHRFAARLGNMRW